ncbi:hypothetical protein GQX73_g9093 [Xylaria multiplex]|uniref:SP-RING-type domain-containing protein n=1 Tax=Xylaria multiplex TaxID=323545 RepID=A0A7C8N1U5_9PEZI|nr:hypothetical protein GQX73_g9093 [Xylaria multiplex]
MPLISGAQRNRGRPRPSSPSSHSQPNRRKARLPDYEPPSFSLGNASCRELAALANSADTRKYEEQLRQSITLLTNNVRDINDRYVKKKDELDKLRKRQRGQSEEDGEDPEAKKRGRAEEAAVARLREAVPALTAECESAIRNVIDLRVELEDDRKAIQDTVHKAELESTNAADEGRGSDGDGAKGEDDDFVMRNIRRGILGPLRILKNEREKAAADYATRSLEERYAVDNDYIGFKRLWWDAVHSVDGKPLPDASRWFTNNNVGGDDSEDDEEADLVIAEEHISIYCPLSMVIMEEPYTSSDISIKDLYDDQVMLRKIKRAQAEKERDVEDDDEDGVDIEDSTLQPHSIKAERARDRGNQLLAGLGLNPEEEEEDAM